MKILLNLAKLMIGYFTTKKDKYSVMSVNEKGETIERIVKAEDLQTAQWIAELDVECFSHKITSVRKLVS